MAHMGRTLATKDMAKKLNVEIDYKFRTEGEKSMLWTFFYKLHLQGWDSLTLAHLSKKWKHWDGQLNLREIHGQWLRVTALSDHLYTNAHFRLTNCKAFRRNYSIIWNCIYTIRIEIFFSQTWRFPKPYLLRNFFYKK